MFGGGWMKKFGKRSKMFGGDEGQTNHGAGGDEETNAAGGGVEDHGAHIGHLLGASSSSTHKSGIKWCTTLLFMY